MPARKKNKTKELSKKMTEEIIPENNQEVEDEVIVAEKVSTPQVALAVGIVRPVITAAEAKLAWKEFQELKKSFLDPNLDYQTLNLFVQGKGMTKKAFIKKSGWRKLATAFNISVEIVKEERKEHVAPDGKPYLVFEVTASAIATNGRFMVGVGSCASNERTFSKLEHDLRATAATRATNRAISDLIGGGEVSAEELEEQVKIKQNSCSVNHENLKDNVVGAGSKNSGRHYRKCYKCTYWAWIDAEEGSVTESESPTE